MNLQIDTIRIDDEKLRVLTLNTYSAMKSASVNEEKSVRSRPTWANSIYACKNIIWINDITEEIGFAGIDLCRCFKLKDIVKIEIVNILPAKGPGGMEFNIILNPKKIKFESRLVFLDSYNSFDSELAMIEKFTGLNIECFEVYDC